MKLHNFYKNLD